MSPRISDEAWKALLLAVPPVLRIYLTRCKLVKVKSTAMEPDGVTRRNLIKSGGFLFSLAVATALDRIEHPGLEGLADRPEGDLRLILQHALG